MAYKYIKAPPGYSLKRKTPLNLSFRLLFSSFLLIIGVAAFTSVIYPLVNYQLVFAPSLQSSLSLSPLSPNLATNLTSPVKTVQAADPTFVPEMINTALDYTDSTNWFPKANPPTTSPNPQVASYYLSIPKLGINKATVHTDSHDLKKSLLQYPGTALPGDLGNTVIFGHSVLPQFFSPTNYISIFSTLLTLKPGDQLNISSEGVEYTYYITQMYEVAPDNLAPLAQSFDAHRLTLITCTPPGTYLRRLIVRAELR
ncbi:MAG: sortase [bacterium]